MVSTVPHIINVCLLSVYYSVLKVISLPTTAASVAIRENSASFERRREGSSIRPFASALF